MAHHQEEKKAKLDKQKLAAIMKRIDICMMTTAAPNGQLHSRPMSNNRHVDWDGDSWFFAFEDSTQATETQANPNVNLAYALPDDIVFVSIVGKGEIVRDNAKKQELWNEDLKRWFPNGPDDDSVVLIKVKGQRADYWAKDGDAELAL
jgi:general stress protein 26